MILRPTPQVLKKSQESSQTELGRCGKQNAMSERNYCVEIYILILLFVQLDLTVRSPSKPS